jgi:hypothetical protein
VNPVPGNRGDAQLKSVRVGGVIKIEWVPEGVLFSSKASHACIVLQNIPIAGLRVLSLSGSARCSKAPRRGNFLTSRSKFLIIPAQTKRALKYSIHSCGLLRALGSVRKAMEKLRPVQANQPLSWIMLRAIRIQHPVSSPLRPHGPCDCVAPEVVGFGLFWPVYSANPSGRAHGKPNFTFLAPSRRLGPQRTRPTTACFLPVLRQSQKICISMFFYHRESHVSSSSRAASLIIRFHPVDLCR